jgi:hypothetical protein
VVTTAAVLAACNGWPHFRGGPTLAGVAVESTIGVGNVGSLVERWRGSLTGFRAGRDQDSPVVTGGRVYTAEGVFDVTGGPDCAGAPNVCQPLWTLAGSADVYAPTTVSGGYQIRLPIYPEIGPEGGTLSAFDAAGVSGCGGVPKVCSPTHVWRRPGAPGHPAQSVSGTSAPVVAGSTVYAGAAGVVAAPLASDASCSGSPPECAPLWAGSGGGTPLGAVAIAGGRAYVAGGAGSLSGLWVYDAAGTQGCSGTPAVCQPLWRGDVGATGADEQVGPWTNPVVDGVVFAGRLRTTGGFDPLVGYGQAEGTIYAFDAAGVQGCSGSPVVCQPLWSAPVPGNSGHLGLTAPAVAGGRLYVPSESGVAVFDAKGVAGCGGSPKVCAPIATLGFGSPAGTRGGVTIANGVAFVGASDGLYAFDANLSQGCSGAPVVCAPLLHTLVGTSVTTPAVVAGQVHVMSAGRVVTLGLP